MQTLGYGLRCLLDRDFHLRERPCGYRNRHGFHIYVTWNLSCWSGRFLKLDQKKMSKYPLLAPFAGEYSKDATALISLIQRRSGSDIREFILSRSFGSL